jgi:hypothetical protein
VTFYLKNPLKNVKNPLKSVKKPLPVFNIGRGLLFDRQRAEGSFLRALF